MKGVRRLRGSLLNPVVGGGYELGGVSAGWEERAGDGIAPGDWCGDRLGAGRGGRQRGVPWAGGGVRRRLRGDTPVGKACYVAGDVAGAAVCGELIEKTMGELGSIDILVNNAGIIRRAPAAEYSAEDWDEVIAVNLTAVFRLSQLTAKRMLQQGRS